MASAPNLRQVESEIKKYEATIFTDILGCIAKLAMDEKILSSSLSKVIWLADQIDPKIKIKYKLIHWGWQMDNETREMLVALAVLNEKGLMKTTMKLVNASERIIGVAPHMIKDLQRLQKDEKSFSKLRSDGLIVTNKAIYYVSSMNKTAQRLRQVLNRI